MIKKFEEFEINEESQNQDEESQVEILQMIMEDFDVKKVEEFLDKKGLYLNELTWDEEDGEWIKIFFGSNDYFGRIPPRISYYMEELAKMISDELGCHVEFGFGKNGDCSTVYFTTAAKLDAKIARVRSALRFDR
jgi:hypothetical protein